MRSAPRENKKTKEVLQRLGLSHRPFSAFRARWLDDLIPDEIRYNRRASLELEVELQHVIEVAARTTMPGFNILWTPSKTSRTSRLTVSKRDKAIVAAGGVVCNRLFFTTCMFTDVSMALYDAYWEEQGFLTEEQMEELQALLDEEAAVDDEDDDAADIPAASSSSSAAAPQSSIMGWLQPRVASSSSSSSSSSAAAASTESPAPSRKRTAEESGLSTQPKPAQRRKFNVIESDEE
jgi:hypothetical protein